MEKKDGGVEQRWQRRWGEWPVGKVTLDGEGATKYGEATSDDEERWQSKSRVWARKGFTDLGKY